MSFVGTCVENIPEGLKELIIGTVPGISTNYNIFIRHEANNGKIFHQVQQSDGSGVLTAKVHNISLIKNNSYTIWASLVSDDPDFYDKESITINTEVHTSLLFDVVEFDGASDNPFKSSTFQLRLCSVGAGAGTSSVRANQSANQAIPNATATKVEFDVENWDDNDEFDNVTDFRFTPKMGGKFQINAGAKFAQSNLGVRRVVIYKNGVEFSQSQVSGDNIDEVSTDNSDIVELNGTTDYIEIFVYQDSGASLNILGGSNQIFVSIHKLN